MCSSLSSFSPSPLFLERRQSDLLLFLLLVFVFSLIPCPPAYPPALNSDSLIPSTDAFFLIDSPVFFPLAFECTPPDLPPSRHESRNHPRVWFSSSAFCFFFREEIFRLGRVPDGIASLQPLALGGACSLFFHIHRCKAVLLFFTACDLRWTRKNIPPCPPIPQRWRVLSFYGQLCLSCYHLVPVQRKIVSPFGGGRGLRVISDFDPPTPPPPEPEVLSPARDF